MNGGRMRHFQNCKSIMMTEDEATTFSGYVDTLGYRRARILFTSGSSARITTCALTHSDDASTDVAIPGIVLGTNYTVVAKPNNPELPKMIWDVNLAGKKRYLHASVTINGTGRSQICAMLFDPIDGATSATDVNAANYAIG
jgi:hypothetical protein